MPGDGFALAVGIGREKEPLGVSHGPDDLVDALLLVAQDRPDHLKVVVGQDRAVLLGQIANVAIARLDLWHIRQVFLDGLGLGRRFDDDDIHARAQSSDGPRIRGLGLGVGSGTSPLRSWSEARSDAARGKVPNEEIGRWSGQRARDPVARMAPDAAVELQVEECVLNLRGRCMALAYDFVNRHGLDP